MGEILVGRLSPQSSGYGLGVITPFSGLSQVSSNNLGFSNDLVSQLQQVQGLNLSQIQVATLLTTISLDRLEGLKEKGVQAVVAEIAPKLQVKEGAVTTVDIVDSLKSISLPQKEVVMVDAPLAVGGQVSTDELAPEGILAKGKPLVVNQGTEDEPVMVAKLNIDQINPGVEVAEQKPIVIETEVRTLTKAEIKMLRANGNVGNLDRVYIPVNMKPSEVKELFSQIKGNIILGDVVLYPFGGNIVIKNSVLNKVVISGKISIVRSDLENVKLATEGGIIRKSVVLGVKMEGTVDVYQSVLINSEVSDQATIGNSLILFAEVESRANVTRSQIVGTDQKPVWVGALTNTYFFHLLGSTMQSKVLEALEASGPALGFFRTNLRKLVGGKAVLVYETGADSKVFKAKLKIKETEYHTLTLAEVTALRQKGIVIANNTKIVVPKGVSIDTLALMIEPGVVLSDKIYMLGNPETIHVEKGTVLDNVMLKGNVKVQASSIIADSVLADSVVEGGTVRDSYLDKTRVETGAVVLRSTIINTTELTVGEYSNVAHSHLANFGVVKNSLIGNTFMENNNGPVIIGGSIFVQNTTVLKNFQSLANAAKTAFIGFFDAMGFELDNIRFASGQTNQILFQIDENGKVVVVIMADIADSESIVEQWTKNLNQIAGRSFVMGMLARPNFPYIEAIQPKLERAQDGEKVSFRVDVVEMTERRAGEQTLTGRKVEWENPDDKVSLLRYIDGKSANEESDRTSIVNFIDRLAEAENTALLEEILYIFEENVAKSKSHLKRIADIVKDLKPETRALLYDMYQYQMIAK